MAVILAITILGTGLIGSYTTVPAAEFSAGALAAYETLEWITAALAGAGFTISVKELLKPRQSEIEKDTGKDIDWDTYDWGDALDSPAAQDQIDELDKTINKLYGNASAKWKEMYEKSLSPTPTPESSPDQPQPSPPVTVAPIDPDTVMPPDWETLRKMSMKNGYLLLGTATYWCLKEAIKGLWNNIMQSDTSTLTGNPFSEKNLIAVLTNDWSASSDYSKTLVYSNGDKVDRYNLTINSDGSITLSSGYVYAMDSYRFYTVKGKVAKSYTFRGDSRVTKSYDGNPGTITYQIFVPYYLNGKQYNPMLRTPKSSIWVNPDLKNDYDNNKSPSIPATAPAPAIKIPSLDDLKDLQNRGNSANDDERPSIILDWLKNHYTNPSTDPNPKPDPDPNPNPDPKPDPDPNPDPNPDPDPNP